MTHQGLCHIRIKRERCADETILNWLIHWLPIQPYQWKRHKTTLRNLVPQARTGTSHWMEQYQKQPTRPWKYSRPWRSLFCSLLHLFWVACGKMREKHFTDHSILSPKEKATIFHFSLALTGRTAGCRSNKGVRYNAICTIHSPT